MKITFVKKIKADGSPCAKCNDVQEKLEKENQLQFINDTLIADERDPQSAGMLLASELGVERAPFFVIEKDNGEKTVYTVYLKFVKEILNQKQDEAAIDKEIMDNNDLDFI